MFILSAFAEHEDKVFYTVKCGRKGVEVFISAFYMFFRQILVEFLAHNHYPKVCDIFSVMTDRMSTAAKPIRRKIRERGDFMSLLQGILTRLVSLKEQAESGEVAQRYFEVNGERKCSVKYFDKSDMYELEVYQQGEKPQVYQFDNIDMVAIEIYDILS